VDPTPDPLLLRSSGGAGNPTRDLWICTRELLPQDHLWFQSSEGETEKTKNVPAPPRILRGLHSDALVTLGVGEFGTVQVALMGVWHRSGSSYGCMEPFR
jgi:hypothetical protein